LLEQKTSKPCRYNAGKVFLRHNTNPTRKRASEWVS